MNLYIRFGIDEEIIEFELDPRNMYYKCPLCGEEQPIQECFDFNAYYICPNCLFKPGSTKDRMKLLFGNGSEAHIRSERIK